MVEVFNTRINLANI